MSRGDLGSLYVTARWRRVRRAFLRMNPVCAWPGCASRATVVDHITPRSQGGETWDRRNWQPLCKTHHDGKTRREQGWWGDIKRNDRGPTAATVGNLSPSAVVTRDYSRRKP